MPINVSVTPGQHPSSGSFPGLRGPSFRLHPHQLHWPLSTSHSTGQCHPLVSLPSLFAEESSTYRHSVKGFHFSVFPKKTKPGERPKKDEFIRLLQYTYSIKCKATVSSGHACSRRRGEGHSQLDRAPVTGTRRAGCACPAECPRRGPGRSGRAQTV